MEKRETVSVSIEEISDCIMSRINEKYKLNEQDNFVSLRLRSNIKFLLFDVIRKEI